MIFAQSQSAWTGKRSSVIFFHQAAAKPLEISTEEPKSPAAILWIFPEATSHKQLLQGFCGACTGLAIEK